MGTKRLSRLTAVDIMSLYALMKDLVVLGDKIDGVQYVDYKAGWDDDEVAQLAKEKMGRHVTHVQVRNLRQNLFGMMRKRLPLQPKLIPEPGLALGARMKAMEEAIAGLRDYQSNTRAALWGKFDELLDYVRQLDSRVRALDAEWGTCRPAGYKPGLPEIINDTKEAP
jgi:hypothetical protein